MGFCSKAPIGPLSLCCYEVAVANYDRLSNLLVTNEVIVCIYYLRCKSQSPHCKLPCPYYTQVEPSSPPSKTQAALPISAYPRNDLACLQPCSLGACVFGGGAGYCPPVPNVFKALSTLTKVFIASF